MWTLWLVACSNTRSLDGRVTDIWGKPLDNVTVVIEGVVERYQTDAAGAFHIEVEPDIKVGQLMAGKEGYIKGLSTVATPAEEGADFPAVSFQLYPEPEKPGFYGVGLDKYSHLKATKLTMVGTELKHYVGVREYPDAQLYGQTHSFVFTSTLRASELSQMNLHLSRLDFIDHTLLKGLLGPADATINLFVAVEEIPYDLKALASRDDYLITLRDTLKPGVYAFHGQNVLNETDYRIIMDLPREMQVVFPFEIR